MQAVVAELGGEKVDIVPWSDDPAKFVANALSPAQVVGVSIDEEARIATVIVPERMLSLAIGREGQNARLAAKLTGWRIDIRSDQPRPAEVVHGPKVADGPEITDGRDISHGPEVTPEAPQVAAPQADAPPAPDGAAVEAEPLPAARVAGTRRARPR